jgi:hypothetical protein
MRGPILEGVAQPDYLPAHVVFQMNRNGPSFTRHLQMNFLLASKLHFGYANLQMNIQRIILILVPGSLNGTSSPVEVVHQRQRGYYPNAGCNPNFMATHNLLADLIIQLTGLSA